MALKYFKNSCQKQKEVSLCIPDFGKASSLDPLIPRTGADTRSIYCYCLSNNQK